MQGNRRLIGLAAALLIAAPLLAASAAADYAVHGVGAAPTPGDGPPTDPAVGGAWTTIVDGEVPAISMALLKDGRVLYWSGVEADEDSDHVFFLSTPEGADSRVYDPATGEVSTPGFSEGVGNDLFCAGLTILPDGRVMATGGTEWTTLPDTALLWGTEAVRVFDPDANEWSAGGDMPYGRWYPSTIPLADGSQLTASGIYELTNPATHQTPIETYDPTEDAWSLKSDRLLPLYPRLTQVPSGPYKGDVYYSTVGTLWGTFGEHPEEARWSVEQVMDEDTGAWRYTTPSLFGARQHGVSVLLPLKAEDGYAARILTFGGTLQRATVATNLAEVTDLTTSPPTKALAAPMKHPRWHANGVLLPTGEVLAVGGGLVDNVVAHGQRSPPVMAAELYDPDTGEWAELAEMRVPRTYHSTAVLLPDARVIVGGHVPLPVPWTAFRDSPTNGANYYVNQSQIRETALEVYEPPYLHRGERPVIAHAPESITYGEVFGVGVANASAIESVALVRPGATTHAFDSNQRVIELAHHAGPVEGGVALSLTAPPDGDVAPPGWYMLFVNAATEEGPVPSVASWVHLE